jgi:hypothetical protein
MFAEILLVGVAVAPLQSWVPPCDPSAAYVYEDF